MKISNLLAGTLLVIGIIFVSFLHASHASALNRSSNNLQCFADDNNYYPFGFMCGTNPINYTPLQIDVSGVTNGGNITGGNTIHVRESWGVTGVVTGPPRRNNDANNNHQPALEALAFVTLNTPNDQATSGIHPTNITRSGNGGLGCPGDGNTNLDGTRAPGKLWGDRQITQDYNNTSATNGVNQSPLAFDPISTNGVINCKDTGRMVYWKTSNPTTQEAYDFDLRIDTGFNANICIRADLSIRFDNDNRYFPPPSTVNPGYSSTVGYSTSNPPNTGTNAYTTYTAADNQHITAAHLVKQSQNFCFNVVWNPTSTYAATLYATCHLDNGPGYAAGTGNIFGSLIQYDSTGKGTAATNQNLSLWVWEAGAWKLQGIGSTNSQGNYNIPLPQGNTESAAQLFGDGAPRDFELRFNSPVSPSTFDFKGVISNPPDCNPSSPQISANADCVNQVLNGNAQDPDNLGQPIVVDIYINGGAQYYTTVATNDLGDFAVGLPGFQNGYDQNFVLWAHDYSGNAPNTMTTAFMQGCGQFQIVPTAGGGLDDTENPTRYIANNQATISYPGWANPSKPAVPSSDSNYILTPSGAQIAGGSDTSFVSHTYNFGYGPPLPPITAGQAYCSYINIGNPSAGIVSNTGQVLRVDATGASDHKCDTVVNKPTFRVYGSGTAAGGDVGACSANGGLLASWNAYDPAIGFSYGAGSQLSALALIKITGFASAQKVMSAPYNLPNLLSFANNNTPTYSSDSVDGGGNFGGQNCITEPTPSPATAASTLAATTVGPTGKVGIDSPGDLYISGNVIYQGNNGATGTAASWTSTDQIPSVVVRAKGNIYIDKGVTELDGIYVAEGKIYTCASGPGTPVAATNLYTDCNNQLVIYGSLIGKQVNLMRTYGSLRDEKPVLSPSGTTQAPIQVYTSQPSGSYRCVKVNTNSGFPVKSKFVCSTDPSFKASFANASSSTVYCTNANTLDSTLKSQWVCENKITTYAPTAQSVGTACSNAPAASVRVGTSPGGTCAAEVFDFGPEFYLSNPNVLQPSGGAQQFDSILSLPPVL